jgi:hypothetical protein
VSISRGFWLNLLDQIEEGRVIPVIGASLVQVEQDGRRATLEARLARSISERLDQAGDSRPAKGGSAASCRCERPRASGRHSRP